MSYHIVPNLIAVAMGAGIIIGAAGLYVLLTVAKKIKKPSDKNISTLDMSIAALEELTEACYFRQRSISYSNSGNSMTSEGSRSDKLEKTPKNSRELNNSDDEMHSLLSSDTEFYDFSSDECWDDDLEKLYEEVDVLLKGNDLDRLNAHKMLETEESSLTENPNILWRLAQLYQIEANSCELDNSVKKKEYVELGLKYANKALEIDPSNCDAHKWYAILVGMQTQFLPVKEKIENGFQFQEHLTIALNGKPDDATLHHLLGRFKYEIANLSWVERKLACALFAEIPYFTMNNALEDFKKADKLNPGWIENGLYIGKCYIGLEDYENAFKWFCSIEKIKPEAPEDRNSYDEIIKLKEKYSKYHVAPI